MGKFSDRYATNVKAEEEGQWVDFGDGIEVKVRRVNSAKSKEVRRQLEKPYEKQFRGREYPDSLQEELVNKQIAKVLIVDWKGVPNPDDEDSEEPFPATEANIMTVITRYKDFREDILTACMSQATFQTDDRKAVEGNSEPA